MPGVNVRPPADAPPDAVGLQVRQIDAVYHVPPAVVAQGGLEGVCSTAMPVGVGGPSEGLHAVEASLTRTSSPRMLSRHVVPACAWGGGGRGHELPSKQTCWRLDLPACKSVGTKPEASEQLR